ncbi:hypothetical protein H9K76_03990 [Diaphorobacter ruginosibacter]|uniref:PAAR domain-containing protein n=1 Tax=Diaphorobacter ruginosibacter TaxID=1715720 RepID=A0A7G9RR15_9BURK|nr:hypothetical protein [Diaphorobacter ruginosibacter]QNN58040.1 hypothetical protein H9K76_03990 [Diaphorobacter ruginosibacter]
MAPTEITHSSLRRKYPPLLGRVLSGASLLLALMNGTGALAGNAASHTASAPQPQQAGGNRIEVTNNSVSNVRCANGGSVSVNSVNVNGAALKGRTVIVQGHNSDGEREGKVIDCGDIPSGKAPASSQVNSITIR